MKAVILLMGFTLMGLTGFGQVDKGDSAYAAQNYSLAIEYYTKTIADEQHGAALYYNLGNAYYKHNEIGKAIWAYQKAHKIDPSNADIQYNLNHVSGLTKDKIEQGKTGIGHWFTRLLFGRSINFWAWMGVFMSILSVVFFFIYRQAIHQSFKSLYLILSISFGVGIVACTIISITHKHHITHVTNGIITQAVAKVMTAPNTEETVSFELHEGAKFDIIKTDGAWVNISINKNQGWVEKTAVLLY